MPFDPLLPANNSPKSSAVMRGQLNGLKALIDAIQSISSAVVDGTSTLPPGDAATVTLSVVGDTLHFSFGIPRGEDGGEGMPGPPFASAVVDGVNTLNPGEPATVDSTFDGSTVHLTFGIPRGDVGGPGPQGEQGVQGEVTNAQLATAIAGTSNLSNAVNTLGMTVSDPPTLGEVQQIADKLDELILALRR